MEEKKNMLSEDPSNEIDLIELVKKIWDDRKIIFKTIAVFIIIGLVIVIGSPREYKSEVTLLVETSTNTSGISSLLQQYGGLSGLSLGTVAGQDALTPQLYPDIIKSAPFLLETMNQKVTESKHNTTYTVAEFLGHHTKPSFTGLIKGYTIGLPGKIIRLIKRKANNNLPPVNSGLPLKLSPEQSAIFGALTHRIKAKEGESKNTLVISVEMQDPLAAAQLADSVVKNLTAYITDYRTQKAKMDYNFIASMQTEAKEKYIQAQQALARHVDQNSNVILASVKTEEQRLQSEYNLAFNVYNTLSQQLEQARIKVQETTPVLKILDPAQVPLAKSKPRTALILFAMILLGGFVGFIQVFWKYIKTKNSNS